MDVTPDLKRYSHDINRCPGNAPRDDTEYLRWLSPECRRTLHRRRAARSADADTQL